MNKEPTAAARHARDLLLQASAAASSTQPEEARNLVRLAHIALKEANNVELQDVQTKSILAMLIDHHRDVKRTDFSRPLPPVKQATTGGVKLEDLPNLEYAPMKNSSHVISESWTEIKTINRATLEDNSSELAQFQKEMQLEKDRLFALFEGMKVSFQDQFAVFKRHSKQRAELQNALAKEERDRAKAEAQLKQMKKHLTMAQMG